MDDNSRDEPLPEAPSSNRAGRELDPEELSLRAALEAAVSAGAGGDKLAELVVASPYIQGLVRQFTGKNRSGRLFGINQDDANDWYSVTLILVWMNARAGNGKTVRKSLEQRSFGAFWNIVVHRKARTARDLVFRDFCPRRVTGREVPEPASSPGDDPASQAASAETMQLLWETADRLPRELDRVVMKAILQADFDPRRVAESTPCCMKTVRLAAKRVRSLIERILRS